MVSWKIACIALFATVLVTDAQLEAESSSDDSDNTQGRGGNLEYGVAKVDKCLYMGQISTKICDPDQMLSHSEKTQIKTALHELETSTASPNSQNQFQGASVQTQFQGQNLKQNGIKMVILLLKNIKDTKETDQKVFDVLKRYATEHPMERVSVIVLSADTDFSEQKRYMFQTERLMNSPVYYYFPTGVWSNLYSTLSIDTLIQPSEIVQLFNNGASELREGTYGVALLNIIHGIRDKTITKLDKSNINGQFNQGSNSQNTQFQQLQTEQVQKVERCLQQFEAKVCDPDYLLRSGQKEQIDGELSDLETTTYVEQQQQQQQQSNGQWANCKKGGIKLATILIKDVQNQEALDLKINEMINQWAVSHPCERTAVMMLSPSQQDNRSGGQHFQTQNVGGGKPFYYYRFPVGVWSKFYGISNLNVPVSSAEIVQLYDQEKTLIRQGEYSQALLDIIRGFKSRAQSRRVSREVDSTQNLNQDEGQFSKKQLGDDEQRILEQIDECLVDIKTNVCDPKNLLANEERESIKTALFQIERDTVKQSEIDEQKKKGFVVTVVMLPYIDEITVFERKINNRLNNWRQNHRYERVAIVMLSANKIDNYHRSKFYGTSTTDSPVHPHQLVEYYNTNKLLIRAGKHNEALLNIVDKIRERAQHGGTDNL